MHSSQGDIHHATEGSIKVDRDTEGTRGKHRQKLSLSSSRVIRLGDSGLQCESLMDEVAGL